MSALTATTTTSTHTPFSQNISFTMFFAVVWYGSFYVTGPIPTINPEDYVFLKAVLYTGCLLRDPFVLNFSTCPYQALLVTKVTALSLPYSS